MTAPQVMECLVLIVAVRRSIFTSEQERNKFLSSMLTNSTAIMRTSSGLQRVDSFHQFCRFLARLKTTYHLSEIAEQPEFDAWFEHVVAFTRKAFQSWDVGLTAKAYLVLSLACHCF